MLPPPELGTFSFCYRALGVHAMGISASSNFAVLYEAMQLYFRTGAPLALEAVAAAALQFERRLAQGLAVAADDVYPITYGGVLKVRTAPNTREGNQVLTGQISVEPVPHDPRWLADHVVVAFNPKGKRHDIPDLLSSLFRHEKAAEYVAQFTRLAEDAAMAITSRDIERLAAAVNAYRIGFDAWSAAVDSNANQVSVEPWLGPAHTRAVAAIAEELVHKLGKKILAWKPPGGGASESMIVLSPDVTGREAVIEFFSSKRWYAMPAYITSGICGEFVRANQEVRITAGHRLDFVGAADLGQDIAIGSAGCCCSCAIEPRTEIILSAAG